MGPPFEPKFNDFQGDIECYLRHLGNTQTTKDGMVVFHGYDEALKWMFRQYIAVAAFDPLVAHFRRWNWELSYNPFLLGLTKSLAERQDWPRLKLLWDGVIAKRRKLYNDVRKIERRKPGALPADTVHQSRERLLETLRRVRSMSEEFGSPQDSEAYSQMIDKAAAGKEI
jgi:hypothetical protein